MSNPYRHGHEVYYEVTISGEDRGVMESLLPEVYKRRMDAEEIEVRCECGTNLSETNGICER
tara:strand:+ start:451 stop:636 length:186 start_codon:yes stop_codon:yes gene_type:complete